MTTNVTYRDVGAVVPISTTVKGAPLSNAEIDGNIKSLVDSVDAKVDSTDLAGQLAGSQADITMNGTWEPFLADNALRAKAHILGNTVVLSGIVQPNGSASTTIGTLPAGYRPAGRTCYMVGRDNTGPVNVQIDVTGAIVIPAVPSWFSLEGITFAVTRT